MFPQTATAGFGLTEYEKEINFGYSSVGFLCVMQLCFMAGIVKLNRRHIAILDLSHVQASLRDKRSCQFYCQECKRCLVAVAWAIDKNRQAPSYVPSTFVRQTILTATL
jgi:hypothetical protein